MVRFIHDRHQALSPLLIECFGHENWRCLLTSRELEQIEANTRRCRVELVASGVGKRVSGYAVVALDVSVGALRLRAADRLDLHWIWRMRAPGNVRFFLPYPAGIGTAYTYGEWWRVDRRRCITSARRE